MESNEFDDIIRKKIDHPQEGDDQRAWDLFMLSAIEKGEDDLFEDRSMDQIVRDHLANVQVPYDGSSWDLLEKKLESTKEDPAVIHQKFDANVSHSLKGLKKKYDAASWPRLAARMEAEEKYLRHYYRAKFVEAVLFIFLVLTLFQVGQQGKLPVLDFKNAVPPLHLNIENQQLPQTINDHILIPTVEPNYDQSLPKEKKSDLPETDPGVALIQGPSIPGQATSDMIDRYSEINNSRQLIHSEIQSSNADYVSFTPKASYTGARSIDFASLTTNPLASQSTMNSFHLTSAVYDGIKPLDPLIAQLNQAQEAFGKKSYTEELDRDLQTISVDDAVLLTPELKKQAAGGLWKFGAYTHTDYNEIYLPQQPLVVQGKVTYMPSKTVKSVGYGAGFKTAYIKNRIGIELGAGYANRSYNPNRKYYGDPEFIAHFEHIEYDIVELPISLRYGSKGNTRLKTYAQAGLNTSIIASAFYKVRMEPTFSSSLTQTLTARQESVLSTVRSQFTKFESSRLLAYAQGAMGAEWKLNQNTELYGQVTYSQRILAKKFGLNFDQAKSLSLEFGIKTIL